MSWSRALSGRLRRSDVRAVALVALAILVAVAVENVVLLDLIAEESIEEAGRRMSETVRTILLRAEQGDAPERIAADLHAVAHRRRVAARVIDANGALRAEFGAWPRERERVAADLRAGRALTLVPGLVFGVSRHLVDVARLPSGEQIELAISLRSDAREAREFGAILFWLWAGSSLLGLAAASVAVAAAFRPLRRATALLEQAPTNRLSQRLPTRGTGDPVDRHAEAVNRTLDVLGASFRRLRDFIRHVAHELRTPLNRIATSADVALLEKSAEGLRETLENAGRSATNLGRLVQSLLWIAEIEDDRLVVNRVAIEGDAWLTDMCDLYGPLFEEHGKALRLSGRVGSFDADITLLDRVLANLLENALAHTSAQAFVEIRGQRFPDRVEISVDDSGPGIPPEERANLFDPAARSTSFGRTGHGLGLPLAHALVSVLGGTLVVEDSPLGGARLRVSLALASEAPC